MAANEVWAAFVRKPKSGSYYKQGDGDEECSAACPWFGQLSRKRYCQ